MRKAVEYEIRLAYYDRIARTLPDDLQDPVALVVPDQAPGPDYEYDDPGLCYSPLNPEAGIAHNITVNSSPLSRCRSNHSWPTAWPFETGRCDERT